VWSTVCFQYLRIPSKFLLKLKIKIVRQNGIVISYINKRFLRYLDLYGKSLINRRYSTYDKIRTRCNNERKLCWHLIIENRYFEIKSFKNNVLERFTAVQKYNARFIRLSVFYVN